MKYLVSTQNINEDGSIDHESLSEHESEFVVEATIDLLNRMAACKPGDALDVTVLVRE